MLVIGLIGGIGTGKSEVSRIFRELGATVIDADRVGHMGYEPHTPLWEEVVSAFGEEVVGAGGQINRKRLGEIVFSDPEARARLNAIMHPWMSKAIREKLSELQQGGTQVAVVEAALLLEAGWDSLVHEVWLTRSPKDDVVERLCQRNNLSEKEIRARIRSQDATVGNSTRADVILENAGSVGELREKVESLWSSRVKGKVR